MIKYDEFCVHCLKVCDLPRHPDEEARSRCVRIIEILISAKANINPRNSKGSTPLMWLVCSSMQYAESLWFSGKGRIVKGLCLHVNPQYLAAPSSWSFDWNGFERDSLLPFVTIAYRHVPLSWNNDNDRTVSCVAKVRMSSEEHWGGEAVSWHPKDLTSDGISGDQLPPDPEADQRGLQIFKLKDSLFCYLNQLTFRIFQTIRLSDVDPITPSYCGVEFERAQARIVLFFQPALCIPMLFIYVWVATIGFPRFVDAEVD